MTTSKIETTTDTVTEGFATFEKAYMGICQIRSTGPRPKDPTYDSLKAQQHNEVIDFLSANGNRDYQYAFPLKGTSAEVYFYLVAKELNLPISISTGKEDWEQGIDFYINGIAIDVTSNRDLEYFKKKLSEERCPTLFLPFYDCEPDIFKEYFGTENRKAYIYKLLYDNTLLPKEFLRHVVEINRGILEELEKDDSPYSRNLLPINIVNLRHLIEYLEEQI